MRLVLTVPTEVLMEACSRIQQFCERHLHMLPLMEEEPVNGHEKHSISMDESNEICNVLPVPSMPVTLGEDRRP
jgi:hypothetical protein